MCGLTLAWGLRVGAVGNNDEQQGTTPTSQAAPAIEPARLYRQHCQQCHGPSGKAPAPEMSFVGRDWKHGTASARMVVTITEGVTGTAMMPFKDKLTPEQITALAKYVRAFDTRLGPEK